MPIKASFLADFSQFESAVKGAEAQLRLVTVQADSVAAGMTRAGLAATASGKMIAGMSQAATTATTSGTNLTGSFRQFDGILASLGIHIGPEIRAIGELGAVAGVSALGLGAVTTAGLVLATGFASWKLTSKILEFTGLDKAIGDVTVKLLGWDALANQEKGAGADALALASQRAGREITTMAEALAANTQWQKAHQAAAKVSIKVSDEAKQAYKQWAEAMVELDSVGEGWRGTLNTIDGETASAIQYYLEAGVAQSALATAYGVTAAQVKSVASALSTEQEALKLEQAAVLATTKLWDEYFALRVTHGGTANKIAIAQIDQWAADLTAQMVKAKTDTTAFYEGLAALSKEKMAGVGIDWSLWTTSSIAAQRELAANARATYNEMILGGGFFRADLEKQLAKTRELEAAARGMGQSYVDAFAESAAAAKAANAAFMSLDKTAEQIANRAMGGTFELTPFTAADAQSSGGAARLKALEQLYTFFPGRKPGGNGPTGINPNDAQGWKAILLEQQEYLRLIQARNAGIPGFAMGGPVLKDGPIYAHAGEFVLPKGGGGGGITVNVNVSGVFDPATARKLADVVSAELTKRIMIGRQWPSS